MKITEEVLYGILDAYPYEIVFCSRDHVVRYMNRTARQRYEGRVFIGNSLFSCHNEGSKAKIEKFLERADQGENEMYELYNKKTGEREFFTPVRDASGSVTGYFERHEAPWDAEHPEIPVTEYWKRRI